MPPLSSPTLKRVIGGQLCSGCGLCEGVSGGAVELTTVAPGFARPRQNAALSTEAEAKIAAACPGSRVAPWREAPILDKFWGPCEEVLTGYAVDPAVRHQASSGGALTALAIHALAEGSVDAVIHVGADDDQPTHNLIRVSTTVAEVLAGAGSRYATSSPLAAIDVLLAQGRHFAFIGKPCDVSALRQLATCDPRVDTAIPLKLSFFCAGIPSHAAADRVVRAMNLAPEQLARFRYRGFGWPGKARAETHDGRSAEMSYADSWGGYLSKDVQFRCKICPDAVGGVADVAAADAWYGGETGYPLFDEEKGRSLIIARTAAGVGLVARARTAGALATEPLAIREIDLMQPSQANRKRLVAARLAACRTLAQAIPAMHGLQLDAAARDGAWALKLRNYLGTMRRIVQGRR